MKIELKTSFTDTVKCSPKDFDILDAIKQLPANPDGWVGVDLSEYDPKEEVKIGIWLSEDEDENKQVFVVDATTVVNGDGKCGFGGSYCETPESALESVKISIDITARCSSTLH